MVPQCWALSNLIRIVHTQGITWFTSGICGVINLGEQRIPLHWRHNDHYGVSDHQPHGCLLNLLFEHRSKKTSKLCVTGLCAGNSPGPVNSPHKGPVTRKMFPFGNVIMLLIFFIPRKNESYFRIHPATNTAPFYKHSSILNTDQTKVYPALLCINRHVILPLPFDVKI